MASFRRILRSAPFAILGMCGLVGADLLWSGQLRWVPDQLGLPTELANYKEWRTLLQPPKPVPLELWIRCVAQLRSDRKRGFFFDSYN
jgi:hypothetical protein